MADQVDYELVGDDFQAVVVPGNKFESMAVWTLYINHLLQGLPGFTEPGAGKREAMLEALNDKLPSTYLGYEGGDLAVLPILFTITAGGLMVSRVKYYSFKGDYPKLV